MGRWSWLAGCIAVLIALGTISPPAGAITKSQLRSKLLTLSNMPTGWVVDNSSSGGGSVTSGCLAGVKQAPKNETKVTASFPDGQLPSLEEELVTGSQAIAAYNRLNHVLAGCKHFTAESGGQSMTATVGAMSFHLLEANQALIK